MKEGIKKISQLLFGVMLSALFVFTSCETEEKVYLTYEVATDGGSAMSTELSNFITQRVKELNAAEFGSKVVESEDSKAIFNRFCDKLSQEATAKGFRIFPDTWVKLQLIDVMRKVTDERKVEFVGNATPKYYVIIRLDEIAPKGDEAKVAAYLDDMLITPYSMKKSSITESENKINTYLFSKEYASYAEAYGYYQSKEGELKKLFNTMVKHLETSNLIYTSKLVYKYSFVNESPKPGEIQIAGADQSAIMHMQPNILGAKGWSTDAKDAPFTSIVFVPGKKDVNPPYFVSYRTTISGVTYDVLRLGAMVAVLNADGKVKYGFSVLSPTTFQLFQADGVDVINGPVYTKVQ